MTMENTAHAGHALKELQSLKTEVLDGAAAVTNIAVTGIAVGDTIQSAVMYAAGVPSNVTAEVSITSAGNIQLATTDSTSNKLVVNWFGKVTP